jgi:hypothetical protein
MCCDSHNGAHPDKNLVFQGDEAITEDERCKCRGFAPGQVGMDGVSYFNKRCVCLRKMDGEDLRCSVCRQYCDLIFTPRVMSKHALAAVRS